MEDPTDKYLDNKTTGDCIYMSGEEAKVSTYIEEEKEYKVPIT